MHKKWEYKIIILLYAAIYYIAATVSFTEPGLPDSRVSAFGEALW